MDNILGQLVVTPYNSMAVDFSIAHPQQSQIVCKLFCVYNRSDSLSAKINVPINSGMFINFTTQARNIIKLNLEPVKDAFVRKSIAGLNYGTESDLYIGNKNGDIFRSFLGYDLSTLPPESKIKTAKLKIYHTNDNINDNMELGLYETNDNWQEKAINWLNQPTDSKFLKNITITKDISYVEYDLLDLIKSYNSQQKDKISLKLQSINESLNIYKRFFAKESNKFKPILVIEYYDPILYNFGFTDFIGKTKVRRCSNNDLSMRFYLKAPYETVNRISKMHVRNPIWLESKLNISRNSTQSRMTVKSSGDSLKTCKILVRNKSTSELLSFFKASRSFTTAKIIPRLSSSKYMTMTITPRLYGKNNFISRININRIIVNGRIVVRQKSDYNKIANIIVRQYDKSELQSDLIIVRHNVVSKINVFQNSNISAKFLVRQSDKNDIPNNIVIRQYDKNELNTKIDVYKFVTIPAKMKVASGYLESRIIVPYYEYDDIHGTIISRVKSISDLPSIIQPRLFVYKNAVMNVHYSGNIACKLNIRTTSGTVIVYVSKPYGYII